VALLAARENGGERRCRRSSNDTRAEQLGINSQCTSHRNLEEAFEAHAAAGFRNAEPHLNPVRDWLDDGHSVEQMRDLFESYGLRVASTQPEIACFDSPDARLPSLRTNAANARLIHELGGDKVIVGTDGPEQNSVGRSTRWRTRCATWRRLPRGSPECYWCARACTWYLFSRVPRGAVLGRSRFRMDCSQAAVLAGCAL
jgi:sugar phosphate isomerase/epimerase